MNLTPTDRHIQSGGHREGYSFEAVYWFQPIIINVNILILSYSSKNIHLLEPIYSPIPNISVIATHTLGSARPIYKVDSMSNFSLYHRPVFHLILFTLQKSANTFRYMNSTGIGTLLVLYISLFCFVVFFFVYSLSSIPMKTSPSCVFLPKWL